MAQSIQIHSEYHSIGDMRRICILSGSVVDASGEPILTMVNLAPVPTHMGTSYRIYGWLVGWLRPWVWAQDWYLIRSATMVPMQCNGWRGTNRMRYQLRERHVVRHINPHHHNGTALEGKRFQVTTSLWNDVHFPMHGQALIDFFLGFQK